VQVSGFILNYADYMAYIQDYRWKRSVGFIVVTAVLGLFLAGVAAVTYVSHQDRSVSALLSAVAGPATGFTVWYAFYGYAAPLWSFRSAKGRGCYAHPCTVVIDENEIRTWDRDGNLTKPWHSLDSVVTTRKHIFIYFNKCGAFIIPKRAFDSAADADVFARAAKDYLAAAKVPATSIATA